jgi:hypothetical protein
VQPGLRAQCVDFELMRRLFSRQPMAALSLELCLTLQQTNNKIPVYNVY